MLSRRRAWWPLTLLAFLISAALCLTYLSAARANRFEFQELFALIPTSRFPIPVLVPRGPSSNALFSSSWRAATKSLVPSEKPGFSSGTNPSWTGLARVAYLS